MHHQGAVSAAAADAPTNNTADATDTTASSTSSSESMYGRDLTADEAARLSDEQKTQFATLQKAAREVWTNGGIDLSHRPAPAAEPATTTSAR